MLKQLSQLEHAIGPKVFKFVCDTDSALPQVKEALDIMMTYVLGLEQKIKAEMEQAQAAAKNPVEVPLVHPVQTQVQ